MVIPLFVPPPAGADVGAVTNAGTGAGSVSCTGVAAMRDEARRTQSRTLRYAPTSADQVVRLERDWVLHWIGREDFQRLAGTAGLRIVSAPGELGEVPADVVLMRA